MKTLGIGSLPHHSVHNAINFSLRHTLPFLPQMTSLGERMVSQVLSSKDLQEKYTALESFTEKILEQNIVDFKIQIAGPKTCEVEEKIILKEINQFLNYFENYKMRPIVFIDEPVFNQNPEQLKNIFNELKNLNIVSGLHSCAKFEWKLTEGLSLDYLSFDIGLMLPKIESQKILVTGIPPFSKNLFHVSGEWVSSNCGLATFTESECEMILKNLESY